MWSFLQKQNHLQKSALFRHNTVFIDARYKIPTGVCGTRLSLYIVIMNNCVLFPTHLICLLKKSTRKTSSKANKQRENRACHTQPNLYFPT